MILPRLKLSAVCCAAVLAFGTTANVFAQDAPPVAAPSVPVTGDDLFKVPDTNDEKSLQMFLQRMVSTPPAEQSPEAFTSHLTKIDKAISQVLAKPINDELYVSICELRFQVLSVLKDLGGPDAEKNLTAFQQSLLKSDRKAVVALAGRIEIQEQLEALPELKAEEQAAVLNKIIDRVKTTGKDDAEELDFSIQLAIRALDLAQRIESPAVLAAYDNFITVLKARSDDRLKDLIENLEGTARRNKLPGNPIVVEGTTLDGKPFNIESLKGKVVLVDFWATWCGPCIAELPHLQELYAGYKDKGFEIIGISLDSEKKELVDFVKGRQIPWPILFEDAEKGWGNKTAAYYGISAIPTVILVGADGKVITTNARGPQLVDSLEKLFGPLPAKKAAE